MSVSGWETRSAASAVTMDDRRARLAAYHQQHQQPLTPPPPHFANDPRSAAARGRHDEGASRHQSFPLQPPHQAHNGHHGNRPTDGQQRRQGQMPNQPPPPPNEPQRQLTSDINPLQQSGHREHVPYADQREMRHQRHASPSPQRKQFNPSPQQMQRKQFNPSPQQAQRKQFTPTSERPGGRPQFERHASMGSMRHNDFSSPPPPPLRKIYEEPPPNGRQDRPYPTSNQHHHRNQVEQVYPEPLPAPLPVRRAAGPASGPIPIELPDQPVRQSMLPSAASSTEDEPANIDDVLLGKRWSVHVISHLYQFQRQELSDYANELVKYLRGHAVMTFEQEFGYSVVIRFTSECVAFHVVEARDIHAEFLMEKAEPPPPPSREMGKQESAEPDELRQRSGSFVVYFPKSAEDASSMGMRTGPQAGTSNGPRRGRLHSSGSRVSNDNGSDGNGGSATARVDPKYVFLLRGNEELMAWVGSWLQRRFQCVIGIHVVRVTEENLRRVTRNWVIEALEREEKVEKARQRQAERLRKASAVSSRGEELKSSAGPTQAATATRPTRAPLLLKYRAKAESDVVKAFTMTMPWASVRRVHALMDGGVGSALGTVPEVIERLEHLYFGNLQKDVASMTLVSVQMEEVEVDTTGKVKVRYRHAPMIWIFWETDREISRLILRL
jgi:hypothetical protein